MLIIEYVHMFSLGLLIGVAVADVDNSLSEKGTYIISKKPTFTINTNIFNVTIMVISKQETACVYTLTIQELYLLTGSVLFLT